MEKLNKRFMVAKIEYYYPSGALDDIKAVSSTFKKASEFVLKELLVLRYFNRGCEHYGYTISDLHSLFEYEFAPSYYDIQENSKYFEKIMSKYLPNFYPQSNSNWEIQMDLEELLKEVKLTTKEIDEGVKLFCKQVDEPYWEDIIVL